MTALTKSLPAGLNDGWQVGVEVGLPGEMLSGRTRARAGVVGLVMATACVMFGAGVAFADERQSLPLAGTDWVNVVADDGRLTRVECRIEEIRGETLTIRRNGRAKLEFHRFSQVDSLFFVRSVDWAQGVSEWEAGNHRRGLEYMDRAINREQRPWARHELLAYSAVYCIRDGRRSAAVERLARVWDGDPQTRHMSLLPLVWDARLNESEKVTAPVEDLTAESVVRRLVACSVWLHVPEHRADVVSCLTKIRRSGSNSRLCALAETQLWRDQLLHGNPSQPIPDHYHDLVRQFPADARGGPSLVLGRMLAQRHQYDRAALALLWLPLMQADDGPLAAAALLECVHSLQRAGRPAQAEQLQRQLISRYPLSSAAQRAGRQDAQTAAPSTVPSPPPSPVSP